MTTDVTMQKRLKPKEVADLLGLDITTVLDLINGKHLRAINVSMGKQRPRWLVTLEDLLAFERSRANRNGEPDAQPRRRKKKRQEVAAYY